MRALRVLLGDSFSYASGDVSELSAENKEARRMTNEKKLSKVERKEQAWDEFERKRKPLRDELERKEKPLQDEHARKRKPLVDEYRRKLKPLQDELKRTIREIDAEDV